MIASGKSHQNLSDYIQFSFKKRFEVIKKKIYSENIRYSGNYKYDYIRSLIGEDF